MQLFQFLVVIISLGCGSVPAQDSDLLPPLAVSSAMVLLWCILCRIGAHAISSQVKSGDLDPVVGARWIEKQLEFLRWFSLAVIVLCLVGFGVAQSLESTSIIGESMFLQSIILLAPGLIMTIGNWSAEQAYGARLGYTSKGLLAHLRSLWVSFRSGLGWIVAPVLLLLGVSDLISVLPVTESTASWSTAGVVALFVLLGMPILIRRLLKTGPMESELEAWITALLKESGFQKIRCLRWDTSNRAFNAMVTGFVGRYRTMMLSDRLLDELPREEIAMVVLHEAAHLKRRHVPIRMLSVMPAWIAGFLVTEIAGDSQWATPLGTAAAILFTMLMLRIVAYRTEFDADKQACKMAVELSASIENVPSTQQLACEALANALAKATADSPGSRKASWLHPGISDRINSARRHLDAPMASSNSAGAIANPA